LENGGEYDAAGGIIKAVRRLPVISVAGPALERPRPRGHEAGPLGRFFVIFDFLEQTQQLFWQKNLRQKQQCESDET
jgi:hypothetical protein